MTMESRTRIYLDNHATTRVDPRVVQAMVPYFETFYGNAHSVIHTFGEEARQAVDEARQRVARHLDCELDEIVFTSGATESNNLAIRGVLEHPRATRRDLVVSTVEHPSVLETVQRATRAAGSLTLVPVMPQGHEACGAVDLGRLEEVVSEQTALVSVMAANNEIGTLQDLARIAEIAHQQGSLFHCDATQWISKRELHPRKIGIDLMSFSAHKFHGPKGVGVLYVRGGVPRIRLEAGLWGGGHEEGRRSGTLNVPGIVGLGTAIELGGAVEERERIRRLRDRLASGLLSEIEGAAINGPPLEATHLRLEANLNLRIPGVDGGAIMLRVPGIAMSSGAACTSNHPQPSHVLRAIGLDDDAVRSSLRMGISRFNTPAEIETVIEQVADAVRALRRLA